MKIKVDSDLEITEIVICPINKSCIITGFISVHGGKKIKIRLEDFKIQLDDIFNPLKDEIIKQIDTQGFKCYD